MIIFEGIWIILQTCWTVLLAIISIIPSILKIVGIRSEIIAAIIGIPVIAYTLFKFCIKKVINLIKERFE